MPLRPWMKFYPADWQADELLGMCTLAARGLWIEMIGIMHKADPYGHLVVNGRRPTDTQLAALARCPPDQIPSLLDELEKAGVYSRTRTGVIYSRRMTRDERRSKDGRKAMITGAKVPGSRRHQASDKTIQKPTTLRVVDRVVNQPPSSLEARDQIPEIETTPSPAEFEEVWRLFPRRVARGHAAKAYREARKRSDAATISAGVRRFAEQSSGKEARYIAHPATWLNGDRWLDETVPATPGNGTSGITEQEAQEMIWRSVLKAFIETRDEPGGRWQGRGYWPENRGVPPNRTGCYAPAKLLDEFGLTERTPA